MSQTMTLQLRINADGTAAVTALRGVQQGLNQTDTAARAADGGVSRLLGSLKGLALTAAGGMGVAALATAFIEASVSAQKMEKALTAISGSSTAAAAELEYVRATADKLGLKIDDAASAYISLSAAAKGTALEGKASRDIFEAVSLAMGKLGKSSADTQGALLAIEQMISKGKVSAEELRGQLGERLPGAFQAAANAMGVTTAELGTMLEKGDVLAEDLLPALSQQLNNLYNDGKAVGGLEAEWAKLVNALGRVATTADQATGATSALGSMMAWATGQANNWSEALQVLANWQQGKGFAFGDRDALAADYALRERLLAEYVVKMKDAQAYLNEGDLDNSAARRADGEALIVRINEIDARTKIARADAKAARAEVEQSAQSTAALMGNGAVQLYQDHQAAIAKNGEEVDKLTGKYDKGIAKKAEYAQMEKTLAEAVQLGSMTQEQANAKLEAFAAAQDKATASSGRHAKALSAEAQVVADIEQKYGLMAGQLDAVWKLESGRGKTAGTSSERWVKDLAAGEGHMTKIVGQFQMAEGTAKGLGANMATFNGQADAAAKYLAQAAAQGKTLWEQFAYYHGGPNEKAWGEKTRAYADAAVKIVADATGSMEDLGQNTGKVITDTLNKAQNAVEGLIQKYLPARAAAEEYAQAQQALALASDAAGLSQEEQAIILQGLQQDLERSKVKASETANAWAEVWKNAVKRIDDTFANLWKDLFSGTKTTLESMKSAIASWLAEVAHALLTKPLVVAITTAMTGATGTAGAAGQAASGASSLGGFSNFTSLASNIFSLGTSFISGVSAGFQALFSGTFGTAMEFAGAGIMSGTGAGIAGGLGAMMPILAPLAIAGGLILNKYFKDQEPRYGAYGATTTGRTDQFEDGVGVKGAFGLTFGMNDMGTANVDAEEMRKTFEGFAKVSQALADFYGKDVEAAVKASLAKASMENWGKNGLMNYAMNAEQAFAMAFADIIKHAAATGDAVAVVMSSVVGSLQGTLEDMADQIERGMLAARAAVGMAEAFQGQEIGDRLGLGAKDTLGNALKLVDYANAMKTSGETIAEAIGRMALNLGVLDAAMTLTGTTTEATGLDFINLANDLAKAADDAKIGMQGLMQLQAAYYQNFFSEEERALKQKEDALKAIARWEEDQGLQGIDSSAAFRKYVESLDLNTEAGRKAYVEAMKMVGAFISLDDALKKLGDASTAAADKLKSLNDLINALDPNRDRDLNSVKRQDDARNALLKTGYQGDFTGASIAAYIDHLMQLGGAFKLSAEDLLKFKDGLLLLAEIAAQKADMNIRILELTGRGEEAIAARRQLELAALDPSLRALQQRIWLLEDEATALNELNGIMDRIYNAIGADDLARELQRKLELAAADARNRPFLLLLYQIEDEQRARQKQLEAEKTALAAAHTARMEALAQEREATQELLTTAQGLLSSIQSALSSLRSELPLDEINLARSRRALAEWASAKQLPDQKSLDRAITGIGGDDAKNYATASAYLLAKQGDLVNLLTLEQLAQTKVSDAEKLLQSLDDLQSALTKQHEAAMAALDAKYALDEDWKKRQLDLLNELLAKMYPDQAPADRMPMKYQLPPVPKDDQERQDKRFGDVIAEIALLRRDMANLSAAQIAPLKSLDDRVKKWDLDGLPGERDAAEMSYLRAA